MKILQLALTLGAGGAEKIAVGLCNRFAANERDEVILVSILDDSVPRNVHYLNELSPKVRFINLHCKTGLQPKAIWRVFSIIKKERPDVVHCHTIAALLLLPSLFVPEVCYIHTIHNLAHKIFASSNFFKRMAMKYLFCRNKVYPITISEACHQSYLETFKFTNDKCIINGSEPLKITEKYESAKEEIESLKWSSKTLVFIHVARNSPQKNHDKLFKAFVQLEKDGADFILVVLGDHYDLWKDKLKESKRIYLLGKKNNVGDYMAQADFFVLSSDYEGLPMTLLEAMSMGVVPISTPAGGVVDVIEDGINGYLAENFDDGNFYQKIKQAISEKEKISLKKIKEDYDKKFSMEVCAKKYYEKYQEAIASKQHL